MPAPETTLPRTDATSAPREYVGVSTAEFESFRNELTSILASLSQNELSASSQESASTQLTALFDKYLSTASNGEEREAKFKVYASVTKIQSNILATREMFQARNEKMRTWYLEHPPEAAPIGSKVKNPYAEYVDSKISSALTKQQEVLHSWLGQYSQAHGFQNVAAPGDGKGVFLDFNT